MLTHPHIEPKQLSTWTQATSELLHRVFGEDRAAASFSSAGPADDLTAPNEEATKERLLARLGVLAELIERAAELYEEAAESEPHDETASTARVLVIHAGDQ